MICAFFKQRHLTERLTKRRKDNACRLCCRQPSLSFCVSVWCWLRHHGNRLSGGCGEDALHELPARSVPQRHQLFLDHADQRGAHRLLQGVSEPKQICTFEVQWLCLLPKLMNVSETMVMCRRLSSTFHSIVPP